MGLITSYKLRVSSYAAALFLAASSALGQVVSGPSSSVTNGIPTFGDATGKRIASLQPFPHDTINRALLAHDYLERIGVADL